MALSNEELSKLWDAANKLRRSLDAGEYKHIVLGHKDYSQRKAAL